MDAKISQHNLFEFNDYVSFLTALVKAVPPPTSPIGPGSPSEWVNVEDLLGTTLPEDYKQLNQIYGYGCFNNFLWLNNPFFRTQQEVKYTQFFRQRLQGLVDGQRNYPQYTAPFSVWPIADGLLPCGFTSNGDILCWLTQGQPREWTVVLLDNKTSENYDQYTLSLSGFLWMWLSGKICPAAFPDNTSTVGSSTFREHR